MLLQQSVLVIIVLASLTDLIHCTRHVCVMQACVRGGICMSVAMLPNEIASMASCSRFGICTTLACPFLGLGSLMFCYASVSGKAEDRSFGSNYL